MNISEAFLVNTDNFEAIINELASYRAEDPKINSGLLETMGYSDPNDFLVVRMLKDLQVINADGTPGKYYRKFQKPDSTKMALALGVTHAYEGLFQQDPNIYQAQSDDIQDIFKTELKGRKSELIIKYISETFQHLIDYCGKPAIEAALGDEHKAELVSETTNAKAEASSTIETNGSRNNNNGHNISLHEEMGKTNYNDLVKDFDNKKSNDMKKAAEDHKTEKTTNDHNKTEENMKNPFDFETKDDDVQTGGSVKNEQAEESNEQEELATEQKDSADEEPVIDKENSSDEDTAAINSADTAGEQPEADMEVKEQTSGKDFVKKAMLRKSDLLYKMKRWDDLIPALEQIINKYDGKEHADISEEVSRAYIRRAITLLKLKRMGDALPALEIVIERFEESGNKEFYDQASMAMLYKAQILEKNNSSELLPLYNNIITRLDSNSDVIAGAKLDQIYIRRFELILQEGENTAVLNACSELVERFKDNSKYIDQVQQAMIKRAEMLDEMGEDEEALQAYEEFLSAFGE